MVCLAGFSGEGFSTTVGFLGAGAGTGFAVMAGFGGTRVGAGFAETVGFLGAGAGSSVRVTGLDVERTPEMQHVSERFGGTPVLRAHIAFGPLAPGHEYVHARH